MASNIAFSHSFLELTPGSADCLLIVDVQEDFLPGGRLAVPAGDQIIGPLNKYIAAFTAASGLIVGSRDWHPQNHCSFKSEGGPWPAHCVQGTAGARFSADLALPPCILIVSKATSPDRESYSDFDGTGLGNSLRKSRIARVWVGGLATEYCVLATVEDALREGFQVVLLTDAIRAINVAPLDGERAIERMISGGAIPVAWRTWPDGIARISAVDRPVSAHDAAGVS
jgi:nicotinamidase/pyrazinamidase